MQCIFRMPIDFPIFVFFCCCFRLKWISFSPLMLCQVKRKGKESESEGEKNPDHLQTNKCPLLPHWIFTLNIHEDQGDFDPKWIRTINTVGIKKQRHTHLHRQYYFVLTVKRKRRNCEGCFCVYLWMGIKWEGKKIGNINGDDGTMSECGRDNIKMIS